MCFYDFISAHINSSNKIAIYDSILNSYTYLQLNQKIKEIEVLFVSENLKKGSLLILQADKSFDSLAYLLCCIKMGIIYIPVDPNSPKDRLKKIITSSQANAILTPDYSIEHLNNKHLSLNKDACCILYTSGSTGIPKGVVCSSKAIQAFIEWSIDEFHIDANDVLTAFAPFHFDLSTFDIFASLSTGASLWLIDKSLGSNFRLLGEYIPIVKPSVWYATPTVYMLLNQYGNLTDQYCPRITLFAGEVFPIHELNTLRKKWKKSSFYNLYGPTETNVCTYFKVPEKIELERKTPYPIGSACSYAKTKISTSNELLITGKSLMIEYFHNKKATDQKFVTEDNEKWIKTGDLVGMEGNQIIYKDRMDRMVKRNGYRIELGEVENILTDHEKIMTVACVKITEEQTNKIIAFYTGEKLSQLNLKMYCNQKLLNYMIPDSFVHIDKLPINSNGKVDHIQLINTFK